MLSFWEKKHFLNFDLIVIGGGIVGLSTAIRYKKLFPNKKILVLERGLFPSGASTKNAGFACFGSLTEILDDLNHHSEQEVTNLVEKRFSGLCAIREEFGDEALGYQATGGFELITENEIADLNQLDKINDLLYPLFGNPVFDEIKDISKFGFSKKVLKVIRNKYEGELDTGRFIQSLWDRCQQLNIKILTGAEVRHLDIENGAVMVGERESGITFKSEKIAVCTNAFTKSLISELDIVPGRGLVMVTKKLPKTILWTGSFHYDKGYVYFRNVDNRVLLGGGRNIDFNGEQSTDLVINHKIRNYLKEIYSNIIMPGSPPEFEMEWAGIMAFGDSKTPIVKMVNHRVGMAVRLGGMGVAVGWQTGGELVGLLSKV
ncbi:NAD(P)/FAD-dependent oxidoreductase [Aquiflexum lacus]|uniref:NAD(P)/FAD-dependent oxidoreductase n=1 Tax=Aquiflexum lacus TaxID=2483805 RepID=UPI001895D08A|nr:FAD-dependent oxidoreductase [Aquiflexum lacus]